MNGLFGVARIDHRRLDLDALQMFTEPLGMSSPAVDTDHAAVFSAGWAGSYQGPDGVCVAGSAHLVDGDTRAAGVRDIPALETVAALYRTYGLDAFARLQGQFCLALCDARTRRVVLATDRFATRVLYYSEHDGHLVFSSRLGWFTAGQRAQLSHQALLEYLLFTTVPHPLTPYARILKVRPGHLLIVDPSGVRTAPYWDMSYPEERNGAGVVEWGRRLRTEIERAVERYVAAERCGDSIGAFLSGGTDSSTVAGMIIKITGAPVKVFSIGYAEPGYDELNYARTAASWFGLAHHEHRLTPAEAFDALGDVVSYYEEPFGNASALPTYSCARLARERGVAVLFAGDGGDELFAGNERYRSNEILSLYQRLPRSLRRLTDPLFAMMPDGVPILGQARRYVRRSNIPNPRRFFSYDLLLTEPPSALLTADFLASVQPDRILAVAEDHFNRLAPETSELNRLLYLDLKLTIADNDLRKVSGMAELAGIEVRYPLLDARLAEFSGRIPTNLKLRGLEKRYLFKRALADFLPPAILKKPKHGFGAPVAVWMRNDTRWRDFVGDLLHDPHARQRGYINPTVLDRFWKQLEDERAAFYGDSLWPWLMLELWHRRQATEETVQRRS
jgi:asparagine synthase (glutamine-hydrolysing)